MKYLLTLSILLGGTAFTSIHAHPSPLEYGADPSEIVYTESTIPGHDEPRPLFTIPSQSDPKNKIKLQYDISAMLTGFVICQTSDASPDADEAIRAIQSLRGRLYAPARQNHIDPPLCTDLTTFGDAVVAICGPEGTWMQSKDAGKMANHIYRYCRAEHAEKIRLGGQYIFNNDTEPKSLIQVYNAENMQTLLRY